VALEGSAELGRPALSGGRDGLTLAWVERQGRARRLVVQPLDRSLRPSREPLHVAPVEGSPLWPTVARCDGVTWLAWQQQEPHGDSLMLARLVGATGATTSPAELAPRGRAPALACVGDAGVVAWSARRGGIEDVYLRWLPARGEPSEPLRVSGETDSASRPALSCTSERCAVAWSDMREGVPEVYAVALAPGAEAAPRAVRLSASNDSVSGAGGAYRPALATTPRGRFIAAWQDSRSRESAEIYAVGWGGGALTSSDRRISAADAPSTAAAIVACEEGSLIAWRDRRRGAPTVFAAAVDGGGRRVSASAPLSGDTDEASEPVAACAGPLPAVAWVEAADHGASIHLAVVECR